MLFAISNLNKNIKESIKQINKTDVDYLHVDVMDGKFVPNKTYTVNDIKTMNDLSTKPLDVHLMVSNPLKYLEKIAFFNIAYVTFHLEAVKDPNHIINEIKATGLKVGISIKPNTDIDLLIPYLDQIDQILLMSVEPGEGGQEFLKGSTERLKKLKELTKNKFIIIAVDGGINNETIVYVKEADMAIIGSYVTNSSNYNEQINNLKRAIAGSNSTD